MPAGSCPRGIGELGDSPGRGNHESPVVHSAFTHLRRVSIRSGAMQFSCSTTKRLAGVGVIASTRQAHMQSATALPRKRSWSESRCLSDRGRLRNLRRHHRSRHRRRHRRNRRRRRTHRRTSHRRGAHRGARPRDARPSRSPRRRRPTSCPRSNRRNAVRHGLRRRHRSGRPGPPDRSPLHRSPGKSRSPSASHSFRSPEARHPLQSGARCADSGAVPRRGPSSSTALTVLRAGLMPWSATSQSTVEELKRFDGGWRTWTDRC